MAFVYEQQRQRQISLLFASVFRVKDFHIQPTIQNEIWKQGNFGLFDSLRKLNEGFLVKCYEFSRIGVPGPICSSEITSLFKFIHRPSCRSLLLCSRLSDLFAVKSWTKTVKICNFGKIEKLKEISWELKRPQQDFKKLRLFRSQTQSHNTWPLNTKNLSKL